MSMGGNGKRVLCVEDHPDTVRMLEILLPDFSFTAARTKAEAVELIRRDGFDLILMDYWLADGTGEEACHLIRNFDQRTPILFVTGSQAFTESKARAIGAQGTLKKASPTFIQELRARTAELAGN